MGIIGTALAGRRRQPARPVATTTAATPAPDDSDGTDGGRMSPVDRILDGTTWVRDDVELVLQAVTAASLSIWVIAEVIL